MKHLQCKNLLWCWLSLIIVLLDQLSKYFVTASLSPYQPQPILPFFNLTLMHNTGAAFGFLAQHPVLSLWLFGSIAIMMSIILIIWMYRLPPYRHWQACALALVLGGALGNLIDRFIHGYVVDFLDFYYNNWHFAAFNIADSAISVGAVMLLLDVIFGKPSIRLPARKEHV